MSCLAFYRAVRPDFFYIIAQKNAKEKRFEKNYKNFTKNLFKTEKVCYNMRRKLGTPRGPSEKGTETEKKSQKGDNTMKRTFKSRLVMMLSLMLAVLLTFSACGGDKPTETTANGDTTTETPTAPTTPGASSMLIAEKDKEANFTLVYDKDDEGDVAERLSVAYTRKLNVTFATKADTDPASGNEIVLNSTERADCKALIDSIVGGYYAIRTVKSDSGSAILVAYKGDLAGTAAVERLATFIDETSGKAEIPEGFEETKAVVTLNENKADKVIDLYLIAGQSNAAGSSNKGNLKETYKNVWFAGEVDENRRTGSASLSYFNKKVRYLKAVKPGLGVSASHIGPEYGMAQIFNDYYSDNPVLIFKSAAGGTALQNKDTGLSDTFGNWYPRSKWGDKEVDAKNSPMGVQYYNFVENFKLIYAKLVEDGYTPKVRGMVWMQGEDDLGAHGTYKRLLKTFITDMRKDISDITGDPEVLEMPFIIGKIATTFAQYENPNVPAFNEMQDEVAESMTNVYTIETSDLIIVGEGGKVVGTDLYHFNTEDAVTLGNRFAEKLLEHYSSK